MNKVFRFWFSCKRSAANVKDIDIEYNLHLPLASYLLLMFPLWEVLFSLFGFLCFLVSSFQTSCLTPSSKDVYRNFLCCILHWFQSHHKTHLTVCLPDWASLFLKSKCRKQMATWNRNEDRQAGDKLGPAHEVYSLLLNWLSSPDPSMSKHPWSFTTTFTRL